jgi:hypothetical protein
MHNVYQIALCFHHRVDRLVRHRRFVDNVRVGLNKENPHYKELLQLLHDFEVEYLIVCGIAIMKYGESC